MKADEYLRDCRERVSKTMGQVARAMGWSVPYQCDIELGRRAIPRDPGVRLTLARECGADVSELSRLDARETGRVDVRDLTPAERERVHALVVAIRAGRDHVGKR